MKVFRKGTFFIYDESYSDDSWSYDQLLKASAFYATCKKYGYDDEISYSLSSIYVYLDDQPGIVFEKKYMDMIQKIRHLLEKA